MMKKRVIAVLLLAMLAVHAENLVFNGDFRLGTVGFARKNILSAERQLNESAEPLKVKNASLVIVNPRSEKWSVVGAEIQLKPDTEYIFRYQMKSSIPGIKITGRIVYPSGKWESFGGTVKLKSEFQTFKFRFRTPKKEFQHPWLPEFGNKVSGKTTIKPATITIRNIELYEDNADASAGREIIVTRPGKGRFLRQDQPVPATVLLRNGSEPFDGEIEFVVTGHLSSQKLAVIRRQIKLRAGEIGRLSIPLPLDRYGAFTVTPVWEGAKTIALNYAVMGKYTARKLDLCKEFTIGVNGGIRRTAFPFVPYIGFEDENPEETLAALAECGIRIVRDHDACYGVASWFLLENQRGKWDFTTSDKMVDAYEKYHFYLTPCLGNGVYNRPNPKKAHRKMRTCPDWIVPLGIPIKNPPAYTWKTYWGKTFMPPLDAWKNYVAKVAEHYRGRINFYEIFNEPNGVMGPELYLPYCRTAYKAIKSADPNAKVLGLCVTTDFGINGDAFSNGFIELGGGEVIDIASFHPYAGKDFSAFTPADRYIANYRKSLRKSGREIPVWNSEVYFLIDNKEKRLRMRTPPDAAAARLATDLGEGVLQSVSQHSSQLWMTNGPLDTLYSLTPNTFFAYGLVPNEVAIAYNCFARTLEGAKPVAKYLKDGVAFYIFRTREGKLCATFWNFSKRSGLSADLGKCALFDVFGNPLPSGEVTLDHSFRYAAPGGFSETEFLAFFRDLKIKIDQPIGISAQGRIAGNSALFTVFNFSDSEQEIQVGLTGGGFAAVKALHLTLQSKSSANVILPLMENPRFKGPVTVTVYTPERLLKFPLVCRKVPTATAGSRISAGALVITPEFREGEAVFRFEMKDTTRSEYSSDRPMWEQDCIELFFDLEPEFHGEKTPRMTDRAFRLFYLPDRKPRAFSEESMRKIIAQHFGRLTGWFPENGGYSIRDFRISDEKRTAEGYRFTLTFPMTGKRLGFAAKTDNAVGTQKASGNFVWGSGPDRESFGIITKGDALL